MLLADLLDTLGYRASGNYLQRGTPAFDRAPDVGHILRAAAGRRACRLEGVYTLRPFNNEGSPVPVVYICEADDLAAADEIHKLVWNQDIVPFLLVRTPVGLPWKLATWGSVLDASLLARMQRKWQRLEDCEARWDRREEKFVTNPTFPIQAFGLSEGLQLRLQRSSDKRQADAQEVNLRLGKEIPDREEGLDEVSEVRGKEKLNVKALDRVRRLFRFSKAELLPVLGGEDGAPDEAWCRKGRSKLPLAVCRPPHVIISAARNFAVYSDEFIVVPPRQIGIVSVSQDRPLLKALALYLSSDFAFYHAFLTSTQFGVQRGRATLESLRQIPVPLLSLSPEEIAQWEALHDRLARTKPRLLSSPKQLEAEFDESPVDDGQDAMVEELNRRVSDALGLDEVDRALVHDLAHVRLALNDGKIGHKDGLGRFLRRVYGRQDEAGGLLGYVQTESPEIHAERVGTALTNDPRKYRVNQKGAWATAPWKNGPQCSFRAQHSREGASVIVIYYSFLHFRLARF